MSVPASDNPRQSFAEAVRYAVDQVRDVRQKLAVRGVAPAGLRYLELGPGTDLAPQLVLAGQGAVVTVADKFLAAWDPDYHPDFYRAFLAAFPEPCPAIEAVLVAGSHDAAVRCLAQQAEDLAGIADASIDLVWSNAVLEHVLDIQAVARELRRIMRTGGLQAHQIDLRDHRDYADPLAHLLMPGADYAAHRAATNGRHGTRLRLPDFADLFQRAFWIEEIEINARAAPDYVAGIIGRLPADSPYAGWPAASLGILGGRIWLRPRDLPPTRGRGIGRLHDVAAARNI